MQKPELQKPEVLEQEEVWHDQIQKREAENLMEDNAIDPEQEESQKKIVQSKDLFFAHFCFSLPKMSWNIFIQNLKKTCVTENKQ